MEKVTTDTILNTLTEWVEKKQPIDAQRWLDASVKLTVLQGEDQGNLFELEQKLSLARLHHIEMGDSVSKAEVKVETTDDYVSARKLEAKIDRITELVRISKIQARMANDMVGQN